MARFIETDDSYINLDHVSVCVERVDGRWLLKNGEGRTLGVCPKEFHPDVDLADVVPASCGTVAYIIWPWLEDGVLTIVQETVPVIAWRIQGGILGVDPIVVPRTYDSEWVLLPMPDGRVLLTGGEGRTYDTLEDARADMQQMNMPKPKQEPT